MTDIIWRYTGDFMAPDIVCRVVRYLQVQDHVLSYMPELTLTKCCTVALLPPELLNATSSHLRFKHVYLKHIKSFTLCRLGKEKKSG